MTKTIMMFIGFLLVLPILPWLPLGISLKGKVIIALESFAIAGAVMAAAVYLPLWQSLLIGLLVLIMTGYFTVKYGLPSWAAEAEWLEGDEDRSETANAPKKRFGKSWIKRKQMPKEIDYKLIQEQADTEKPDPIESKQNMAVAVEEKKAPAAANETIMFEAKKEDAAQMDDEKTPLPQLNDLEEIGELAWPEENHFKEKMEKEQEMESEDELEELELLFAEDKAVIKETDEEVRPEDEDNWLNTLDESADIKHSEDTKPAEDESDLYLLELFEEEEKEDRKKIEILDHEEIQLSDDKEKEEGLADYVEKTEERNEQYLSSLFEEDLIEAENDIEETIPEMERAFLLESENEETKAEDIDLTEDDMIKEKEVFLTEEEEQKEEAESEQEDLPENNAPASLVEEVSLLKPEHEETKTKDIDLAEGDIITEKEAFLTEEEEQKKEADSEQEDLPENSAPASSLEEEFLLEPENEETEAEDFDLAEEDVITEKEAFLTEEEERKEEADSEQEDLPESNVPYSMEEEVHDKPEAAEEKEPRRLSPEWLHIIVQEIEVKQKALPYEEVESVMKHYLQAPLHDRDYYIIGRMLTAFYMANDEPLQALALADELEHRLRAYPVLVEEIINMKEIVLNQSLETGERDEKKQ
ncbi:hypothetical protein [Domibacillus robiginosus]|uniref:hypothetical protein n=1 Tax=Domibacillus robiginosus TaxID=1071054 RepID=UPI00067D4A7D|nr:hypothetical protein [Domibacillus robiginosus]